MKKNTIKSILLTAGLFVATFTMAQTKVAHVNSAEILSLMPETKTADGYTWGKLKSGAGWIAIECCVRL